MSTWRVNKGSQTLTASTIEELQQWVRDGRVSAADLVQGPDDNDWQYASEVAVLQSLLPSAGGYDDDDDLDYRPSGGQAKLVVGIGLALVLGIGGYVAYDAANIVATNPVSYLGSDAYSKLIVTSPVGTLRGEPREDATKVSDASKDAIITLMSKRGDFYKARLESGTEGWIHSREVLPLYKLGDKEMKAEYDPLYNPDAYVFVQNASWMQLPEQREQMLTVFNFAIKNESQYDVTDLVLEAVIFDSKGHALETVEFPVKGVVPGKQVTMAGTMTNAETGERYLLTEATKSQLAEKDPNVNLAYSSGCEVAMSSEDFTNARVEIVELRAIPNP